MRLPFGIRKLTAPAFRWVPVRIRAGPNRDCLWSLAASARHLRGRFESARIDAIRSFVSESDCAWDAGAHHGYVTLALSRRVGPTGRVYAFEPAPYNLAVLRRHVAWNRLANVDIMPVALGGRDGAVRFGGTGSSQTFRIDRGNEFVQVASVASLLAHGVRTPDFLKLDVEGAEADVLEAGAAQLAPTAIVMVSIHSRPNYDRVADALAAQGFELLDSPALRHLRQRDAWGLDDPDLLAVGPDRRHLLDRARRLAYFSE